MSRSGSSPPGAKLFISPNRIQPELSSRQAWLLYFHPMRNPDAISLFFPVAVKVDCLFIGGNIGLKFIVRIRADGYFLDVAERLIERRTRRLVGDGQTAALANF